MAGSVELIEGAVFTDVRGSIRHVNRFNFADIRRFYQIEHKDTTVIRAWQGHKIEHKHFFVSKGKMLIATVKIDDWENPSKNLLADTYLLTDNKPTILSVAPGYANGIKAISAETILIVYSSLSLADSGADRYSFDQNLWLDWSQYK